MELTPTGLPGPPTRDKHWIQSLDVAQVECLGVALHMRVVCQSQRKDDGSRRTTREPVVSDKGGFCPYLRYGRTNSVGPCPDPSVGSPPFGGRPAGSRYPL